MALDIVLEPGLDQGRTFIKDRTLNALVCLDPDVEQVKMRVEKILTNSP